MLTSQHKGREHGVLDRAQFWSIAQNTGLFGIDTQRSHRGRRPGLGVMPLRQWALVSGQGRIAVKRSEVLMGPRTDREGMVRAMRATGRTSSVWIWAAAAALTVGMTGVGGPATAAPPGDRPGATAAASVPIDDTITIDYTVNRAAKQISAPVSCTLDGDAIGCGVQTGSAKKVTSYALFLTGLDDGVHTFAVTFTMTDGGTATATAEFTIATVPPGSTYADWADACTTVLGGDSADFGLRWNCSVDGTIAAAVAGVMEPICDAAPDSRDSVTFLAPPALVVSDCHLIG